MDLLQTLLNQKLSLSKKEEQFDLEYVKRLNRDPNGSNFITYQIYLSLNPDLPEEKIEYYKNVIKLMIEIENLKYQDFINLSKSNNNIISEPNLFENN
jgi:hypothetical protein